MADKKIDKITIVRSTVFNGAPTAEGDIHEVTAVNRNAAHYLLAKGKAVAGAQTKAAGKDRSVKGDDIVKREAGKLE